MRIRLCLETNMADNMRIVVQNGGTNIGTQSTADFARDNQLVIPTTCFGALTSILSLYSMLPGPIRIYENRFTPRTLIGQNGRSPCIVKSV